MLTIQKKYSFFFESIIRPSQNNLSNEFMQSVHGQAVARGVSRSPACTECHGIHKILVPVDHNTNTPTTAVGTDSCARCHEGVALTQEFGVASERVSSYKDSYHGLASELGSKVVANCASCHANGFLPRFASSDVDTAFSVAVAQSQRMLTLIADGDMPPACGGRAPGGRGCLSADDFSLIQDWVGAGTPR